MGDPTQDPEALGLQGRFDPGDRFYERQPGFAHAAIFDRTRRFA
jgi:hypothetical protein